MFELSKELLENIQNALTPSWEPAMSGPQVYYACNYCTGKCSSGCKNTCQSSTTGKKHR